VFGFHAYSWWAFFLKSGEKRGKEGKEKTLRKVGFKNG
jgi:hypothetical protein